MADTVLLPSMYIPRRGQRFDFPMATAFMDLHQIQIERECRWAEQMIRESKEYRHNETFIVTVQKLITYRAGWTDLADWALLAIVDYTNGYTNHCGAYLRINWLTHELFWWDGYGALPFDDRMPVADYAYCLEFRERRRLLHASPSG